MKGKNHFYQTLERAKAELKWFHMELKGSQSGILRDEDLAELRSQLTEAQYEQEIECNPNAAVMGTYYSDILAKMEGEERMGHFPADPHEMVHVSADLGFSDSTAFWFWQVDEQGPILIDYYEDDGKPLEHYFRMLEDKGYEYADIWLPHDAKAKSLQTGRSTIEQFIHRGFPCKPVPKLAVQHGIDAARLILPACRFDRERCHAGIEALRAYRRQWNEKTQQFANTPLHDWASNGSDAFRYFALVTDDTVAKEIQEKKVVPLLKEPEYSLNDLYEARDEDWRSQIIRL
jgi:phage terminase large subunit